LPHIVENGHFWNNSSRGNKGGESDNLFVSIPPPISRLRLFTHFVLESFPFFCVFFFCFRQPPNVPQNNKGVLAPLSNPQPPFKGGPPHLTGGSLCTPKPLRGAHHHARCARVPAGNPLNPPSSLSFCLPGRGI